MSENSQDALDEQLQALVGTQMSAPNTAADPVNMPMIRQWTDAFTDRNPVYEDDAYAAKTRHQGLVAPPAMMPVYSMGRPKIEGMMERGGMTTEVDSDSPLMTLDAAGFIGSLATNSEFEFERELRLDDVLSSEAVIESISPKKKTGLGFGYFLTWVTTYTDQHGGIVGRQRFTLLKFDPSTMGAA